MRPSSSASVMRVGVASATPGMRGELALELAGKRRRRRQGQVRRRADVEIGGERLIHPAEDRTAAGSARTRSRRARRRTPPSARRGAAAADRVAGEVLGRERPRDAATPGEPAHRNDQRAEHERRERRVPDRHRRRADRDRHEVRTERLPDRAPTRRRARERTGAEADEQRRAADRRAPARYSCSAAARRRRGAPTRGRDRAPPRARSRRRPATRRRRPRRRARRSPGRRASR